MTSTEDKVLKTSFLRLSPMILAGNLCNLILRSNHPLAVSMPT